MWNQRIITIRSRTAEQEKMGWDCWKQMGCRWKYYQSQLKKSLKNNLNAFKKESLLQDAFAAAEWFDASEALEDVLSDRQK